MQKQFIFASLFINYYIIFDKNNCKLSFVQLCIFHCVVAHCAGLSIVNLALLPQNKAGKYIYIIVSKIFLILKKNSKDKAVHEIGKQIQSTGWHSHMTKGRQIQRWPLLQRLWSLFASLLIFPTYCLATHPFPCLPPDTAPKVGISHREAVVCPGTDVFKEAATSMRSPGLSKGCLGQPTLAASHTQLLRFPLNSHASLLGLCQGGCE